MREADGSSYQGYLYTPGGVWHDLAVDLDELMLSEGSHDDEQPPRRPPDQRIMVADLSNLSGEAGASLGIKTGRQQMWLDDIARGDELAPHRSTRGPEGEAIIDDFERLPLLCLPIGAPTLTLTEGPVMATTPRCASSTIANTTAGRASSEPSATSISRSDRRSACACAPSRPAPLTVVLEERDGTNAPSAIASTREGLVRPLPALREVQARPADRR